MADTTIPKFLYHAAPICVRDSIEVEGLKSIWGVYAAANPEDALRFMGNLLLQHYHGIAPMEIEGQMVSMPNIVEHESIDVWKIDARMSKQWEIGTDHSPAFFGEDTTSFVNYRGIVPRKALKGRQEFAPVKENSEERENA